MQYEKLDYWIHYTELWTRIAILIDFLFVQLVSYEIFRFNYHSLKLNQFYKRFLYSLKFILKVRLICSVNRFK